MQNQSYDIPNSQDKVVLELQRNARFAGLAATDLWMVTYLERVASEDESAPDAVCYNTWHSEYYLDTPDHRVMAAYAYTQRCNDPMKPSKYAMSLDHLGIPRTTQADA